MSSISDPILEAASQLRTAAVDRVVFANTRGHDGEDEPEGLLDKELDALKRLIETVPTSAAGAIAAIDSFLGASFVQDIVDEHPEAERLLLNIRVYLSSAV